MENLTPIYRTRRMNVYKVNDTIQIFDALTDTLYKEVSANTNGCLVDILEAIEDELHGPRADSSFVPQPSRS